MHERLEFTQAELEAEAARRFGSDPLAWAFQCPNCGDVAAVREWPEALRNRAGQECIGRSLGGERGCNWASYGLIRGPWTITLPEGSAIYCFPLAEPTKME